MPPSSSHHAHCVVLQRLSNCLVPWRPPCKPLLAVVVAPLLVLVLALVLVLVPVPVLAPASVVVTRAQGVTMGHWCACAAAAGSWHFPVVPRLRTTTQ